MLTAFGAAGTVLDAKIPTDRATGRPRGFAFVEFQDRDAAEKSIDMLNGTLLRGRPLRVNLAENRPPRPEGGGGFAPRGDFGSRDRGRRPGGGGGGGGYRPRPGGGGGGGGYGQRPFSPRPFGSGPPPESQEFNPKGFAAPKRRTGPGKGRDFEKRKRDEGGRTFDRKKPAPAVVDDRDDYDE